MRLNEFDSRVGSLLQPAQAEHADSAINGIQVERNAEEIERVAFAVDACLQSIRRAAEWKADLLFVHHGLYWGAQAPLTGSLYLRVRMLMETDMALYAMHLPLDMHPVVGNNAGIADFLELEQRRPFGTYKGLEIGVSGRLPAPRVLQELAASLGDARVLPFGPDPVRSVGIVSGAAPRLARQAADQGLDCYVTGEFTHELYHECMERGISVIYGGHYATEVHGVQRMSEWVRKELGLAVRFVDVPTGM